MFCRFLVILGSGAMVVLKSPKSWWCGSYARFHGACRFPIYVGLQDDRLSLHQVINVSHKCLLLNEIIDAGISIEYNMIAQFWLYITMILVQSSPSCHLDWSYP